MDKQTKLNIDSLKDSDIYSLILFALFKMQDIPEYSSTSELAFILDENNFLKLCEYFGGLTITIPRISDLEYMMYALLMYQKIVIENQDYVVSFNSIKDKNIDKKRLKSEYDHLIDILNTYSFVGRHNE